MTPPHLEIFPTDLSKDNADAIAFQANLAVDSPDIMVRELGVRYFQMAGSVLRLRWSCYAIRTDNPMKL